MNFPRFLYQNLFPQETSKNIWKAFVFLIAGVAMTVAGALDIKFSDELNDNQEFDKDCNELKTKIETRLHLTAWFLRSSSALFSASDSVTRLEWKEFSTRSTISKKLPGTQGLGYSMIIHGNQLKQHIKRMHQEGFTGYAVKPSGTRELYAPVIYIEPFTGSNIRALGFDMLSEPICRKAMEFARETDKASLTSRVVLIQENVTDKQATTLMYVPVYQKGVHLKTIAERRIAIIGWVYSPLRMDDFIYSIITAGELNQQEKIHLQLYDERISQESILFDSQKTDTINHVDLPSRTLPLIIKFNEKKWIVFFTQSEKQFSYLNGKVLFLIIGGISISFLLFILSLSLYNTRYSAQQIAERLSSELGEGQERFHILLNSSAEAIFGLDHDGNCTFSNTACLQLLGYKSHEELLGKNMHALIHYANADGSSFQENDSPIRETLINGKRMHADDEVLWRADGTYFQAEYWSYPIIIHKKITGAVVSFFDITERKHAEELLRDSQEKLRIVYLYARSLIEASLDPLVTINADGKIMDVNVATENAIGLSRDLLIGTEFSDYFTEPDKARIAYLQVFAHGHIIDYPLILRNQTGKLIDVLYSASVYRSESGEILGVFASARDITKRKLAEEKLKESESLLKESNISKDRFISILAHDLKSPFNSILGFLDLLNENIREYEIDEIEKELSYVYSSAKRFYDLLEDLLLWAVAQSGKLPFEPRKLNCHGVCKEVLGNFILIAKNKNIIIDNLTAKEIAVFADINMFKTILRNLISNAVKFTNSGGRIAIYAEQNQTTVTMTVSDNGIGIGPEKLAKMFDISYTISTEGTAKEKGTGLGLLLCKDFVEKHGGKIWVESTVGKGSEFKFSMPIFSET